MKVNKTSEWTRSIQSQVKNIATNAGGRGPAAKYHSDTSMIYFFQSGKENPSVAKIIANDEIRNRGVVARIRFFNKFYSRKFDSHRQEFEDSFTKLYPKTGLIRTELINNNRIVMDRVKPKASKFEKIMMFCKIS